MENKHEETDLHQPEASKSGPEVNESDSEDDTANITSEAEMSRIKNLVRQNGIR
jgi:hypothetical protein